MRYLTLPELFDLHRRLIVQTGGASGVRDLGRLEAALAQPRMTFDGTAAASFQKGRPVGIKLFMHSDHTLSKLGLRRGDAIVSALISRRERFACR